MKFLGKIILDSLEKEFKPELDRARGIAVVQIKKIKDDIKPELDELKKRIETKLPRVQGSIERSFNEVTENLNNILIEARQELSESLHGQIEEVMDRILPNEANSEEIQVAIPVEDDDISFGSAPLQISE